MPFSDGRRFGILAVSQNMRIWSAIGQWAAMFGLVCLTQPSSAASACLLKLEWQSTGDPTVTGYALYFGVNGGPLTNRVDVGLTTFVVLGDLTAETDYSFYMVAYDSDGAESDPSNELLFTARAISSLRMGAIVAGCMSLSFDVAPGAACHVEYTDTLSPPNWKLLAYATGDSDGLVTIIGPAMPIPGGNCFYRATVP
jgi:hypothetical protein